MSNTTETAQARINRLNREIDVLEGVEVTIVAHVRTSEGRTEGMTPYTTVCGEDDMLMAALIRHYSHPDCPA